MDILLGLVVVFAALPDFVVSAIAKGFHLGGSATAEREVLLGGSFAPTGVVELDAAFDFQGAILFEAHLDGAVVVAVLGFSHRIAEGSRRALAHMFDQFFVGKFAFLAPLVGHSALTESGVGADGHVFVESDGVARKGEAFVVFVFRAVVFEASGHVGSIAEGFVFGKSATAERDLVIGLDGAALCFDFFESDDT